MKLEDCKKIPDGIKVEECKNFFKDVISSFDNNSIEKKEFLEMIVILTDKQCQTYEILEEEIRKLLDKRLAELWNTNDYDDVDCITYIVANIGLVDTYGRIVCSLENSEYMDKEILQEIQEFVDESDGDISNPYRFL